MDTYRHMCILRLQGKGRMMTAHGSSQTYLSSDCRIGKDDNPRVDRYSSYRVGKDDNPRVDRYSSFRVGKDDNPPWIAIPYVG
jgi:hypothetical protein